MLKALILKGSCSTNRGSHNFLCMCDILRSDGPSVGVYVLGRWWGAGGRNATRGCLMELHSAEEHGSFTIEDLLPWWLSW